VAHGEDSLDLTFNLILKLKEAGYVCGQVPFREYGSTWKGGLSGIANIQNQLSTQLPFNYVQLISTLVKLTNLNTAIVSGILWGLAAQKSDIAECFVQIFSITAVPTLMNLALLLNANLANPFGDHQMHFSETKFDGLIERSAGALREGVQNKPAGWYQEQWKK